MLSSLTAFLPNALHPPQQSNAPQQASKEVVKPDNSSATTEGGDAESVAAVNEMGVRRREKRSANETFIIVRPPPSKSNHPLNLQVQLVPPSNKERSRRDSIESTATNGADLQRTMSNRSDNASVYSSYSSAQSITSVGSTSTTSSGRRMIIPLYNLQAHNVMTNVIADAGTDAKIAKFYKRGMEVIGLAVLEPTEVYGQGGKPTILEGAPGSRSTTPDPAHTPQSSQLSLLSSSQDHHHHPQAPTPEPKDNPASSAKKLFGRFFKKKDAPVVSSAPSTPKSSTFSTGAGQRPSKRASLLLAPGGAAAATEPAPILMPAVLGVQPALSAATYPPTGRPGTYTWTVRRWLKGAPDSVIGNVVAGVLGTVHAFPGGATLAVELRFEWRKSAKGAKRGRSASANPGRQRSRSRGAGNRNSMVVSSATHSRTSLDSGSTSAAAKEKRRSSQASDSLGVETQEDDDPTPRLPNEMPPVIEEEDDGGDDSDPEDSETPWTCTLIAKRVTGRDSPTSATGEGGVRVKVASLAPTPHHPKVVAALKVPFPLPDIEVDALSVRKRFVTPAGVARPAAERQDSTSSSMNGRATKPYDGLVLTAEEIKDIVSSTGMWLVCREGIGGVGRVSRKGDGWRIRA